MSGVAGRPTANPIMANNWMNTAWSAVKSQLNIDRVAETCLAAGVALGAYALTTAKNSHESMESLALTGTATSLTCFAWALGCAVKGQYSKSVKRLVLSLALGGAVANRFSLFESSALVPQRSNNDSPLIHVPPVDSVLAGRVSSISAKPPVKIIPEQVAAEKPKSVKAKVEERSEQVRQTSDALMKRVEQVLKDGGSFVAKTSTERNTSGSYLIKDKEGKIVAIFKPEDEGTWRPNNPNPQFRKHTFSDDAIYFHELNSWEQGKQASRQLLAEMLFTGQTTKMPRGAIVRMQSDQFFDAKSHAAGEKAPVQTKLGFLQEWIHGTEALISYHPSMKDWPKDRLPPQSALDLHDNPILDAISLDQFQEIGINDIIIYNEDRQVGNLLVAYDDQGKPNLIPIDNDAILPFKLKSVFGIYKHQRTKEPFTQASLKLIEGLDPEYIGAMVEKMGLAEQTPINARVLAMVVKKFAAVGGTLHDIESFVSFGNRDKNEVSQLWKMIKEAKEASINRLPKEEKDAYKHNHYLRRANWCKTMNEKWCEPLAKEKQAEADRWQKDYLSRRAKPINEKVDANFWDEINQRLDNQVEQLAMTKQGPNCERLGTLKTLCWRTNELKPGVTHYKYEGRYDGLAQRFELIKVKHDAKAKLKVQNARGVFKKGERSVFGRLHLTDIATRVPNAIAAISGGNFHYKPPHGQYYEWEGSYLAGDPVGELVVKGKKIADNPAQKHWGAFRIDYSGKTTFVDTNDAPNKLDKDKLPQYSLGAVPMLIRNGRTVTTPELGPSLSLKPKQASAPGVEFRTHINMQHARVGVCKTDLGDHLLVVVEGRQKQAAGLRMAQFGRFLKGLGCKDALNLDGGGTADLVTKGEDGQFLTTITSADPKGKRPVASSIVITED